MTRLNEYRQPIGDAIPHWTPARLPDDRPLVGRYASLERLNPTRHTHDLAVAYAEAEDGRDWTYMAAGPFVDVADYASWAEPAASSTDPWHYALIDHATGRAVGTLALMRHDPQHGVIEVGNIALSRRAQGTPLSTEAQFLLMRYVFEKLGYRRYEWKCDALNEPSRRAAQRLGFTYEGTFRQTVVTRGRNRDTAWFSVLDSEWPRLRAGFEAWLAPSNFGDQGQQISRLAVRI